MSIPCPSHGHGHRARHPLVRSHLTYALLRHSHASQPPRIHLGCPSPRLPPAASPASSSARPPNVRRLFRSQRLLSCEPSERLSANGALQHPFFDGIVPMQPPSPPDPDERSPTGLFAETWPAGNGAGLALDAMRPTGRIGGGGRAMAQPHWPAEQPPAAEQQPAEEEARSRRRPPTPAEYLLAEAHAAALAAASARRPDEPAWAAPAEPHLAASLETLRHRGGERAAEEGGRARNHANIQARTSAGYREDALTAREETLSDGDATALTADASTSPRSVPSQAGDVLCQVRSDRARGATGRGLRPTSLAGGMMDIAAAAESLPTGLTPPQEPRARSLSRV
jgi:hypothetical protein